MAGEPEKPARRAWWQALALDITPLRQSRDYRLLFTGQFVSSFGSAVSYVVLPWQMYQLTRSTAAVGLLGLAEFIPMFIMGFLGGALADYVDRRRLVILAEAVLTVCCAVLVANALQSQPRVGVLYAMAALFAAVSGLHRPAIESLTPRLVPAEAMPAVASLASFRFAVTFIAGASLAGVVTSTWGAAVGFAFDGATFLVSLALLAMIGAAPPPEKVGRPSFATIREGWAYARRRQELLGTYLIDMNAMFFGMPLALFPAIAEQFGGRTIGLLYAMPAVGALVVTVTSGWTKRVERHGLAVIIAAGVWGLAIVGFGLAHHLWLALLFLVIAFGADTVSGIFRMTIWNQTIPDHLRGRLAGIELVSYTTGPYLGNAEAGLVASLVGLRGSVVSGGVLCVLGTAALAWWLPRFTRYRGREGLAHRAAEEAARSAALATSPGG